MHFISVLKWASSAHILIAAQRMGSELLSYNSSIIFGYGNVPMLSGFIKSFDFCYRTNLSWQWQAGKVLSLFQNQAEQLQYFQVVYICCQ